MPEQACTQGMPLAPAIAELPSAWRVRQINQAFWTDLITFKTPSAGNSVLTGRNYFFKRT
jgi:hypothetical protein